MTQFSRATALFAIFFGGLSVSSVNAAQRAFVASYGADVNTATGCTLANPCRSFSAGLSVVDSGGEVLALDAAGYGPVTISKSVTLTANPGIYAGISISTGYAVSITTPSIDVILRNLTINGLGGADTGVAVNGDASISIENCVISNLAQGIVVDGSATIRISDTLLRNNWGGAIRLERGAIATVSQSKLYGVSHQLVSVYGFEGRPTSATISDSIVSGGGSGVSVLASGPGATARASVTRSTVADNSIGISVMAGAEANALVTLDSSMVVGNTATGLSQNGASATLESLGNNAVRQNGANTSGTITTVSPT